MDTNKLTALKVINDKIFKQNRQNLIFIYTQPKVGSTTLVTSLRLHLIHTHNIIHIHDDVMMRYLIQEPNSSITVNDIIEYNAQYLHKNVYVINVYRTPVEKKMSEYFEKLSPYHFNNSEKGLISYPTNTITSRFNSIFPHIVNGDHYFNAYNIPAEMRIKKFDYAAKYTMQNLNGVTYILLRLKDSDMWGSILSRIMGRQIIMVRDYETAHKEIGGLYLRFKAEYKLPTNFLDDIDKCPYLNFYYSDAEKLEYIRNWQNRSAQNFVPYTEEQYQFYVKLCLENQHYPDLQIEHYKDAGCVCEGCTWMREKICRELRGNVYTGGTVIHEQCTVNYTKRKMDRLAELIKHKKHIVPVRVDNKKTISNRINNVVYNK